MNKSLLTVAVATLALAACDNSDHTIVSRPPGAEEVNTAAAAKVVLPPAIVASKIYRCKDNSLLYVDWLADNSQRVKTKKDAVAEAAPAGAIKGTATDSSISYNGKSCKA